MDNVGYALKRFVSKTKGLLPIVETKPERPATVLVGSVIYDTTINNIVV